MTEKGDLLALARAGRFDVIVHGCNCFCAMGGGIARAIREEFPEAYAADLATLRGSRGRAGASGGPAGDLAAAFGALGALHGTVPGPIRQPRR